MRNLPRTWTITPIEAQFVGRETQRALHGPIERSSLSAKRRGGTMHSWNAEVAIGPRNAPAVAFSKARAIRLLRSAERARAHQHTGLRDHADLVAFATGHFPAIELRRNAIAPDLLRNSTSSHREFLK